MIKYSLFLSYFLLTHVLTAQTQQEGSHQFYIQQYKDLAIQEMLRTYIPASITLAQAILESAAGQSELALMGQNHFGIKCGSSWTGTSYQKIDDDYDHNGMLSYSCFRVYTSVQESFQDHSNFLTDPQKTYRYGSLFNLDNTDYRGWAYGLKQAGYATSETYPLMLIALIERYNLQQYDLVFSDWNQPAYPTQAIAEVADTEVSNLSTPIFYTNLVTLTNTVPQTITSGFETASDIAYRTRMPLARLLNYNEGLIDGFVLHEGQKIYLAPKLRAFNGPLEYHELQANESVYDVAQKYGVQLKTLQWRNRLEPNQSLAAGVVLKLSGSRVKTSPLQLSNPMDGQIATSAVPESLTGGQTMQDVPLFHLVKKNDTLWNIALRYNTNVEQLKRLNNLRGTVILRGIKLRVQ